MKKNILLPIICMTLISGCANVNTKEISKLPDEPVTKNETVTKEDNQLGETVTMPTMDPVQKELYTFAGEHREQKGYTIKDDFSFIFPSGKITRIKGSTAGTLEKDINISAPEIEEMITTLERDGIALVDNERRNKSLELQPETKRQETYGQIILEMETTTDKYHELYLHIHADDVIYGVSSYTSSDVSFAISAPKLASKLREKMDFKVVDLTTLERASSAVCTSIFNGKSTTLTGDKLKQFTSGILSRSQEKEIPLIYAADTDKPISLKIILDDGEIIHGVFRGHGYDGQVSLESETFNSSVESAHYLRDLFIEKDIPQSSIGSYVSYQYKHVDPDNYLDAGPPQRNEAFFLSYASAANYESVVRLGGKKRDPMKVLRKNRTMTLPEGMVVNVTTTNSDGKKVLAIPSEQEVLDFVELLESAKTRTGIDTVDSNELNMVILNTSGEYSILLLSLYDDHYDNEYRVNCKILSENAKDHGKGFTLKSKKLYDFVATLV
jgi:uncharacterized protein YceK